MSEWQPIETAPKDRSILLWVDGECSKGQWNNDQYAKKPRPFWHAFYEDMALGRLWMRAHQPTHWMKLPEVPR